MQRLREFHPECAGLADPVIAARLFTLHDVQWALAREYGYGSWRRLREVVVEGARGASAALTHNERIDDPVFRRALDLLDAGDAEGLRVYLKSHPRVVHQEVRFEGDTYFTDPTLLEFIAENPIRQGHLPENVVDVARVILGAGAAKNQVALDETLMLIASGRLVREAGSQRPLIELLCRHGATAEAALHGAVAHQEWDAAEALLAQGARLDLPTAAALGRQADVAHLLPGTEGERQLALALAANAGRAAVVREVLAAGADPNRFNPPGAHSHCTALHSAAWAGHLDTVRVLIESGARSDIGDIHHRATALDWARHAGHGEVAAYLERLSG
ncbi:MAG: ankyrin repeat domain-containing protein [Pseudomonadota bacterium]